MGKYRCAASLAKNDANDTPERSRTVGRRQDELEAPIIEMNSQTGYSNYEYAWSVQYAVKCHRRACAVAMTSQACSTQVDQCSSEVVMSLAG